MGGPQGVRAKTEGPKRDGVGRWRAFGFGFRLGLGLGLGFGLGVGAGGGDVPALLGRSEARELCGGALGGDLCLELYGWLGGPERVHVLWTTDDLG